MIGTAYRPWPSRSLTSASSLVLAAVVILGAAGCDEEAPDPVQTVVITSELNVHWELLPHRVSNLEVTLTDVTEAGGTVRGYNGGGSFGFLDTPGVGYGMEVWQSRRLVAHADSVTLEIPPGSEVEGEPFTVRQTVVLPQDSTIPADNTELGAFAVILRGYAIHTDRYDTPPPFETDPTLPYDPVDGYTTQGLGIRLGPPVNDAGSVSFDVTVRNSLGLSDRGDMNAAVGQASTWVRVDYLVVGAPGAGRVARGEVAYELSTAEYGQNTDHPHADPDLQEVALQGDPGLAHALFGISAFDVWVNVDGHRDPDCVVTQDATNAWDEPISGPGRYLTELGVRLWDTRYDASAGAGQARLDLHFSNRSVSKEVGNLCVGARGEVVMVQLDDPNALQFVPDRVDFTFDSGADGSQEVAW